MDKLKGSLYGFIIGDALGVPVEFMKREQVEANPVTDMRANAQRNTTIGYWSDDTAMTLCSMKSIIKFNDIDYKDIMDKFQLWVLEGYMSANDICFGIGQRTLKALSFYNKEINNPTFSKSFKNFDWIPQVGTMSENLNNKNTSGNGSLMKTLPVALYLNSTNKSLKEKINIMKNVSSMTHGNNECVSSCIYYMCFIEHFLKTNNIIESFKLASEDLSNNYDVNGCGQLDRIINTEFWDLGINDIKSTGYVIDTLEASLWCLYHSISYKEAVLKAVNLGDDADTVGAITGSLAGLYYGYDSIPKKWIKSLMKKELIDKTIEDFLNVLQQKDNQGK